ncbi:MAG: hypothetical protein JEY79_13380 [Pseudodesulfovibrio sp.]|nr:hypothetical protein [Pseudodesulfovibrio sp.]
MPGEHVHTLCEFRHLMIVYMKRSAMHRLCVWQEASEGFFAVSGRGIVLDYIPILA